MDSSSKGTGSRLETFPYDVADFLKTPEDRAGYLDVWFDESPEEIRGLSKAVWDIARAQGIDQVTEAAGLSREAVEKSLSEARDPSFATVMNVLTAMGIRLRAEIATPQGTEGTTDD